MAPEEITAKILEQAGPVIITLLGTLATWATWHLKNWLDAKVHDARFHCATEKIAHFTENAIAEAEQTTVKTLKETKKWDADAARTVRDGVVGVVRRHLGKHGMAELKGCMGHGEDVVEGLIRTQIEATIHRNGNGD